MLVAIGCSIQQLDSGNPAFSPCTSCPTADGGGDVQTTDVSPDGTGADASGRSSLCGLSGCIPDLGAQCTLQTNSQNEAPAPPSPDDGGTPAATCRVSLDDAGIPQAGCAAAGPGKDGAACTSSSDCAGGFVCIEQKDVASGACRAFCCYGAASCEQGNYCSIRAAYDELSSSEKKLYLPVCAVATKCQLLTPGECEQGEACVLVATGTTTCQQPGVGTTGEKCPCADGFVCAQEVDQCQKLCHTGHDEECPGTLRCISGNAAFPAGVGVCVTSP
jgi:hypothetical protein